MKKSIFGLIAILVSILVYSTMVQANTGLNITLQSGDRTTTATAESSGVIHVNGVDNLTVSWPWVPFNSTNRSHARVTLYLASNENQKVSVTTQNASTTFNQSQFNTALSGLTEGSFVLKVEQGTNADFDNLVTLHTASVIVDKVAPVFQSGELTLKDLDEVDIKDARSNTDTILIGVPLVTETNLDGFQVQYAVGSSTSFTTIPSAFASNIITVSDIRDTIPDGVITFRVRARDKAGNLSVAPGLSISYTKDTVAPPAVTNLRLRDGNFDIPQDGLRKGATQLVWTNPAGVADISYYNIYRRIQRTGTFQLIGSGTAVVNDIARTTFDINTTDLSDVEISYRVIAVDQAGNELPLTNTSLQTVTFTKRERNISFNGVTLDVKFDSPNSGVVSVSGVSDINATQRETLSVVDENNIIKRYVISTDNHAELDNPNYVFKTGNAGDLERDLRLLDGTDSYYIVIQDEAGNGARIQLNLNQVGPILPSTSRSLNVTSTADENNKIGVRSTVSISFTQATNATSYKVYVNGEEQNIVSQDPGVLRIEIVSLDFGDVENTYEVRAFNSVGNFISYLPRTHRIEDLVRPYGSIISTSSDETSINATIELIDPKNLLTERHVVLYRNNIEVSRQVLVPGIRDYSFIGLFSNTTNYKIQLEGAFRFNNQNFPRTTVLNADTVYNIETHRAAPDIKAFFASADIGFNSVSFSITSTKRTTSTSSYVVQIFDANGLVSTTPPSSTITNNTDNLIQTNTASFQGLTNGRLYQARVLDGTRVIATYNFFTQKTIPTVTVSADRTRPQSLSFDINLRDPDGAITTVGYAAVVKLFDGNQMVGRPVNVTNLGRTTVEFNNLNFDRDYSLRVFVSHQIADDFNVLNDILLETTVRTAKQVPTARVEFDERFDITDRSIRFDVRLTDNNASLQTARVQLYLLPLPGNNVTQKVGTPIPLDRGLTRNLTFSGLLSNRDYIIVIEVAYDLNDGGPVQVFGNHLLNAIDTFERSDEFTTRKSIPTATITASSITNQSMSVQLSVVDNDNAYRDGLLRVFAPTGGAAIITRTVNQRNETFVLSDLLPNTEYRIVFEASYDVGAGLVTRQNIQERRVSTHPNLGATIALKEAQATQLITTIEAFNYQGKELTAQLLLSGNPVGNPVLLAPGIRDITFSNLQPRTIYNVVIVTDDEVPQELARLTLQTTNIQLREPSITIVPVVSEAGTISFSGTIDDPDDTITGPITIQICLEDGDECETIVRSVNELANGISVSKEPGAYTITLLANSNIGNGVVEISSSPLASVVPVIPEPEPAEDPVVTPVVPREPLNLDVGVLIASVAGVIVVGFTGLFFLSFRRFYVR